MKHINSEKRDNISLEREEAKHINSEKIYNISFWRGMGKKKKILEELGGQGEKEIKSFPELMYFLK